MKSDIQTLINKIKANNKKHKLWTYVVGVLSCIVFIFTIYHIKTPALTYTMATTPDENGLYELRLIDTYQGGSYAWKESFYEKVSSNYVLDLYFENEYGNLIGGTDVEIKVGTGEGTVADKFHAFGETYDTTINTTGLNLIEHFNLEEIVTTTGGRYKFSEVKIKIDETDNWYSLEPNDYHRHIYCLNSAQTTTMTSYGWRSQYVDKSGTIKTLEITNDNKENVKFKFIYKTLRYENAAIDSTHTKASLDNSNGIIFKMFNYTGELTNGGTNNINNNGTYDYFVFRDSNLLPEGESSKVNPKTDADGFGPNRAHVLPTLGIDGYPTFDCKTKGGCSNNFSLGYLFGATTNPAGTTTQGVTSYIPNNTPLQTEIENDVKYYYYDSSRNAVDYDTLNNQFMVRDYKERGESMTKYTIEALTKGRYEFMPFNYWNDYKEEITHTTGVTYNYPTENIDHWFGMTMEFEFYMPKDGKINGQDMIFSFSGDDDVWVFIDDVLVLDLGGTHGAVDGSINFATGFVEGYLNWEGKNHKEIANSTYYNKTNIYKAYTADKLANNASKTTWKEFTNEKGEKTNIYEDYTPHTLKFFYLERGAAVSNCKIRFNIPVLPPGSLSVKKEFNGTERYNETFDFVLHNKTTGSVVGNKEYTLKVNGNPDTTRTTDASGKFSLKVGEEAVFTLDGGNYSVSEVGTGSKAQPYSCNLDGASCSSATDTGTFTMTPEGSHQVVFTNTVKTLDLTVSKNAYDEATTPFGFQVTVKNKFGSPVDIPSDINSLYTVVNNGDTSVITFDLVSGNSITIKGIPLDTEVTLQEISHDGYHSIIKTNDNETLIDGDTYQFTMDEAIAKDIVVHNIPGVVLPETGGTGIGRYLIVGTFLILTSMLYTLNNYFKVKEGGK